MDTKNILEHAAELHASDLFIIAGRPLSYRKDEQILAEDGQRLLPEDTFQMIQDIYRLAENRDMERLHITGDDDFSFALPGICRFRINAYKQRGSLAAVIRIINFSLPTPEEMHIPSNIISLGQLNKGLVLVTGPAGSGKSTTLACIIDHINHTAEKHIITLEDPLEYFHRHNKSIVSQREINTDTENYVTALRAALRQSPDVILLGEMRDYETIQTAMTAAETGHLVFSTLHTVGAANTIDRIIDVFPANQQQQIAVQLSMTLQAVISQQFVPDKDGHSMPAFEFLTVNSAIRNMIRDNKVPQIDGMLYSASGNNNMYSMDTCLADYYKRGIISKDTALMYASNPEMMKRKLV
ncbi:PilT/PilU family type 4a pilus ATPase [Roseburia hominis]